MQIIQIFLPLTDNEGTAFAPAIYAEVRHTLTETFGGLTAFTRAPAEGIWKAQGNSVVHDKIVIFEIMADKLDADWWHSYRKELEGLFSQDKIIILAQTAALL